MSSVDNLYTDIRILNDENKFRHKLKAETVALSPTGFLGAILGGATATGGTIAAHGASFITTQTAKWTLFGVGFGTKIITEFSLLAFLPHMIPVVAGAGTLIVGGIALQKLNANVIAKARFASVIDELASVTSYRIFLPSFFYMKLNKDSSKEIQQRIKKIMVEDWGFSGAYVEQCMAVYSEKKLDEILNEIKELKNQFGNKEFVDVKEIKSMKLEKIAEKILKEISENYFFFNESKTAKNAELTSKIVKICLGQCHYKKNQATESSCSAQDEVKELIATIPKSMKEDCKELILIQESLIKFDRNVEEFKSVLNECGNYLAEVSKNTDNCIQEATEATDVLEKNWDSLKSILGGL